MSARMSAVVSLIGLVLMGFVMLSADETPSTTLRLLQYAAVGGCLLGLLGALLKIGQGQR
jgi:hypothetical protein